MEYVTLFFTVGVISLLAAMSPGPDFAVVMKNSLLGSRKIGLVTAIGVGLGILLHVAYSLVGIGVIISQSIILFSIIKYLGALYIFYIAYQLLKEKRASTVEHVDEKIVVSLSQAFREGLLTNALNPKATLFFLSIFTQVVDPNTPLSIQALLGAEVSLVVMVWFLALSLVITVKPIKALFMKAHYYVMKVMGGVLVLLGLKLALSTKD